MRPRGGEPREQDGRAGRRIELEPHKRPIWQALPAMDLLAPAKDICPGNKPRFGSLWACTVSTHSAASYCTFSGVTPLWFKVGV